tara:strand:+ start:580 stop:930 length:351 start_codon:yes stop_codon:yes gene_type:complete
MKKIIVFINVFILLSILTSCESTSLSGEVEYVVNCSPSGFDITYQNSSGNTAQQDISSGSWTYSFTGASGDFVYISAQADNENATVTTKIYYKGKLIEDATSNGDYVIATASGSLE